MKEKIGLISSIVSNIIFLILVLVFNNSKNQLVEYIGIVTLFVNFVSLFLTGSFLFVYKIGKKIGDIIGLVFFFLPGIGILIGHLFGFLFGVQLLLFASFVAAPINILYLTVLSKKQV